MFIIYSEQDFLRSFCARKRTGDRGDASVITEVVAVEDNRGSVRVLEALLRLKGLTENIRGDDATREVSEEIVDVCVKGQTAVRIFNEIDIDLSVPVKKVVLLVLPDLRSVEIGIALGPDREMVEMDKIYPEYAFASNKGYGTAAHYEGMKKLGPCPIHRKSFL